MLFQMAWFHSFFVAVVTICSAFGAQENKICHCFHFSPIYLPWSDRTGCHDIRFWMLSFKPVFLFSSFTFIKRLFSSSSLSAIEVVSSAYLWLLIFLQAILIPACESTSLAFCMMYSAHKLSKQRDYTSKYSLDVLLSQSWTSPCLVLSVVTDFSGDR